MRCFIFFCLDLLLLPSLVRLTFHWASFLPLHVVSFFAMRPFHVLFPLGLPVLLLNHHAASALEYMSRVAMHESFAEGRKPSGVLHSSDWYDTW